MHESSDAVEVKFAFPTSDPTNDVSRVARIIGSFDVTGLVIDSADVGVEGWILARTLGDKFDSTLMRFDADKETYAFDLPWDRVRLALAEESGGDVSVGPSLDFGDHVVLDDGLFALGGDHRAVVIAPVGNHMLTAAATGVGANLVAAELGGRILISREYPAGDDVLVEDLSGGMLGIAAALGRVPSLVLWRRGAVSAYALMRRGGMRDGHVWEPDWLVIEPVSLHRHALAEWVGNVTDDLRYVGSDGVELTKVFSLDKQGSMRLRSILRPPGPDFPELLEVLGLPPEAAEVVAGRIDLADLPGAQKYTRLPLRQAIAVEMSGTQGPPLAQWFEREARELHWSYLVSSLLGLVVGAVLWQSAGQADAPWWMRPAAVVLIVGTLAGLSVRRFLRRRRRSRARPATDRS